MAFTRHAREFYIPVEGQPILVEGHWFIATNVRIYRDDDGTRIVRFTGICTDDPCNDSIRHLGYNGGTYGWSLHESA